MTDQKTTNDKSAQAASAETGAQDPAESDKAATDGSGDFPREDRLRRCGFWHLLWARPPMERREAAERPEPDRPPCRAAGDA